jgi:hypothetical protein
MIPLGDLAISKKDIFGNTPCSADRQIEGVNGLIRMCIDQAYKKIKDDQSPKKYSKNTNYENKE